MRIKIQQFLAGKCHSWSIVGKSLGRSFLQLGHQVDFVSTDGKLPQYIPNDLAPYFKDKPEGNYDLQLSYTMPHNFPVYLTGGLRLGIWCYEFPLIPANLAKYHNSVDYILPPSEFAKKGFLDAGVPEAKLKVIPHGIDLEDYQSVEPYPLKTKRNFKFFYNLGQSHLRKNIAGTIEGFYRAFTKEDDVCLVAKISKPPQGLKAYESANYVMAEQVLQQLNKQYPNHPPVELITQYVPNVIQLYQACQVSYSLSHAEGFYMPGLEAIAAGKLVVAPRYGGQLDYCRDDNSLLVEGKVGRAPRAAQYWEDNSKNYWFEPDLDDAASKLKQSYQQYDSLLDRFHPRQEAEKYQWKSIAKSILAMKS